MTTPRRQFIVSAAILAAGLLAGCNKRSATTKDGRPILRIGYFPNISHAQALVGVHETNTKGADGWFEKATGAVIEWTPFNAGPSAIEALLTSTGDVDATFVGPNPALNGYITTQGANVRILTGAARGGTALVVQPGLGLKTAADFRGKKIATPQLGNTQDVAARAWLKAGGLNISLTGGDAFIVPTANPQQLDLFRSKQIDAVWTVEPWVSRLEMEAGGEVLLEQKDAIITVFAASVNAVNTKRELLKKFIAAHEELTKKITAEPAFAKAGVSATLLKATTKAFPPALLDHAWPRLVFTTAVERKDFESAMQDAVAAGTQKQSADLTNLFLSL